MDPASPSPLSQEHRWCRLVVDAAPTAMILADGALTIRLANRSAQRLFASTSDALCGRSLDTLLPGLATLAHDLDAGTVSGLSTPGGLVDVERVGDDATPVALTAALTPIETPEGRFLLVTLLARADRAEHDARLRMIVEAAPTAVLITDSHRTITIVNRKAEALFGYSRGELLGQAIDVLVPERARDAHPSLVAGYLTDPSGRPMGSGRELHGLKKSGAEVPIEIGLEPVATPDGPLTLVSIIDISARKAQEDELRRSNAELEQFAYVASHDLQEPLRMVASYTELLGQRYKGQLDEKADKYIFYAVDGAKRMQRLVADLLAYSRIGSQGKPLVPVSSDTVFKSVVHSLAQQVHLAGATIDAGELPMVLADEGQLRQLFQNLVANAIKFRGEAAPRVIVEAAWGEGAWTFSVADNGIGIDAPNAGRIFQMFQRLHERGKYEGSGIGLSIAKRIVERHGGHIWFDSIPGVGTTFHFTLPPVPGRS